MSTRANHLASLSWDQASYQHDNGYMTDKEWEAFAYVWRTFSPRFSDVGSRHESRPRDPEVRRLAAQMKRAVRLSRRERIRRRGY